MAKPRRAPHRIVRKRAHREVLNDVAVDHWAGAGRLERAAYLARVRAALLAEGFRSTPFQWRHRGHAFGLVKPFGHDRQIHVRVYDDGIVDSEVEIHKRYVQHIYSPRPSAHRHVQRIFAKHGIPAHLVNEHYLPRVGADRIAYPKRRVKVAHAAAAVVGGLAAVGLVRFALRRLREKDA